jgi:hypothetical protein
VVAVSLPDTVAHIERVQSLILTAINNLSFRAVKHDLSKLEEPEKSAFDRLKALSLSGMAYGSEEYRACLRAEKPAIEHHYKANSHHPEFYPKRSTAVEMRGALDYLTALRIADESGDHLVPLGKDHPSVKAVAAAVEAEESSVGNMSLFDVLEMLLDWKAATERMKDGGDIRASLVHNIERFKLSPQLAAILGNTLTELGW